jgi:hypothetical protein
MQNTDFWVSVVKLNGVSLRYVPEDLKTVEICNAAVSAPAYYYEGSQPIFYYVPDELKTAQLCLEAMKHDGANLEFTPEKMKTAEVCFTAVGNGPTQWTPPSIAFVPENLKTYELCLAAVEHNENAKKYVPEQFKTSEPFIDDCDDDDYDIDDIDDDQED